jgi:hypothetical protein
MLESKLEKTADRVFTVPDGPLVTDKNEKPFKEIKIKSTPFYFEWDIYEEYLYNEIIREYNAI